MVKMVLSVPPGSKVSYSIKGFGTIYGVKTLIFESKILFFGHDFSTNRAFLNYVSAW